MKTQTLLDCLRAWPWLLLAILTTAVVGWIAPHQLGVLAWSLSKLCLGAYLGYWIDRSVFYYARPNDFLKQLDELREYLDQDERLERRHDAMVAMIRRAIIMASAILALGLGV